MNKSLATIEIDGQSYKVPFNETIIQSCFRVGIEVPRFCYHEKLSIAGNCRMCLVEISYPKSIKPIASCALPIIDNMKIFTNTILVKKARESVLEFLLANHPLDCPICDQGGECDLQDQTLIYGSDRGRFYEIKRTVKDKEWGPLIKTVMTRCIHCTRCVRFCNEIAGIPSLGVVGRGSNMEIGTYIDNLLKSEISGNVIDLCPVGALTSKPYSFIARPWELRTSESCDILDSFCSSIRMDIRGTEIMRILPLMDKHTNEEWISDRTRFFYDGLKRQRLDAPLLKINNILTAISWGRASNVFLRFLSYYGDNFHNQNNFFLFNIDQRSRIFGVVGNNLDIEAIAGFKYFLYAVIGSNNFFTDLGGPMEMADLRSFYCLPTNIDQMLDTTKLCFLLDINPRLELPLFNLLLRKRFIRDNQFLIISFGEISNLTYYHIHLSQNLKDFLLFVEGKNFFCRKLPLSKNPLFFINKQNNFKMKSRLNMLLSICSKLFKYLNNNFEKFNNFYFLSLNTTHIIANELGFLASKCTKLTFASSNLFCYSLCGNYLSFFEKLHFNSIFIYQGHHGDKMAFCSNLVFPIPAFTEKNGLYLNYYGQMRRTKYILSASSSKVRNNWQIFKFLNYHISFTALLEWKDLFDFNMFFFKRRLLMFFPVKNTLYFMIDYFSGEDVSEIETFPLISAESSIKFSKFSDVQIIENGLFMVENSNFYLIDSITKSSYLMSLCSQIFSSSQNNF